MAAGDTWREWPSQGIKSAKFSCSEAPLATSRCAEWPLPRPNAADPGLGHAHGRLLPSRFGRPAPVPNLSCRSLSRYGAIHLLVNAVGFRTFIVVLRCDRRWHATWSCAQAS